MRRELMARSCASLIGANGYPPEGITHRALNELFLLCACLADPEILAETLYAYYCTVADQKRGALGETPRFSLRLAIERNQIDDRLEPVWMRMIRGDEAFLPGSWEDGFAALGRSFHALALLRSFKSPKNDRLLTTLESNQFCRFRQAIAFAQAKLTEEQVEESRKGMLLEAALHRWEDVCPALGAVLRAFVLDACHGSNLRPWVRETLEGRLRIRGTSTLNKIIADAAENFGYNRDGIDREMPNLLKKAEEVLDDDHNRKAALERSMRCVRTPTSTRETKAEKTAADRQDNKIFESRIGGLPLLAEAVRLVTVEDGR